MPSTLSKGYKALLDEANAQITTIAVANAIALLDSPDHVLVDLRDPQELTRDGKIGAFFCTRGMLEFWIDPESPYAKPIFQEDKTFVFYCASPGVRRLRPRRRKI